jgi:hypothetical protein
MASHEVLAVEKTQDSKEIAATTNALADKGGITHAGSQSRGLLHL